MIAFSSAISCGVSWNTTSFRRTPIDMSCCRPSAGTLVAVSLFVAVLIAAPYQFFPLMPPGMVSLRSLDDRFFFTSASMLVMALAAVAQWDALALDARDTAALGVLPIPRAVIVRTKFMAVALLAIGVAVAWNLAPTLLRFVAVPPKLGVSLRGALALTLAHGVTTLAAGAFGFLAVLGLREVMSAIAGTGPVPSGSLPPCRPR